MRTFLEHGGGVPPMCLSSLRAPCVVLHALLGTQPLFQEAARAGAYHALVRLFELVDAPYELGFAFRLLAQSARLHPTALPRPSPRSLPPPPRSPLTLQQLTPSWVGRLRWRTQTVCGHLRGGLCASGQPSVHAQSTCSCGDWYLSAFAWAVSHSRTFPFAQSAAHRPSFDVATRAREP